MLQIYFLFAVFFVAPSDGLYSSFTLTHILWCILWVSSTIFVSYIFSMCVPNLYVSGYFHSLMTHLKSCCVCIFYAITVVGFWWLMVLWKVRMSRGKLLFHRSNYWNELVYQKHIFTQIFSNLRKLLLIDNLNIKI